MIDSRLSNQARPGLPPLPRCPWGTISFLIAFLSVALPHVFLLFTFLLLSVCRVSPDSPPRTLSTRKKKSAALLHKSTSLFRFSDGTPFITCHLVARLLSALVTACGLSLNCLRRVQEPEQQVSTTLSLVSQYHAFRIIHALQVWPSWSLNPARAIRSLVRLDVRALGLAGSASSLMLHRFISVVQGHSVRPCSCLSPRPRSPRR